MRYQIIHRLNRLELIDQKYDRITNEAYHSFFAMFDNSHAEPIITHNEISFWYVETASSFIDTIDNEYITLYEFDDILQFILDHPELFI